MTNSWFRLYSEFANDPKVQMMSEAMQRRLVMLFCLRCNGNVTLHATPSDDEVTFLLRITGDEWRETKALFIAKGFIDETNNVLNWDKRQFRSDSSAERVARHRAAKKNSPVTPCNVTVTPPDTDTERKEVSKEESKNTKTSAQQINSCARAAPMLQEVKSQNSCAPPATVPAPGFQTIFDSGIAQWPHLTIKATGAIHAMLSDGCDPALDVLPAIEAIRTRGQTPQGWAYLRTVAVSNRDARLAPTPLRHNDPPKALPDPTAGLTREQYLEQKKRANEISLKYQTGSRAREGPVKPSDA